MLNGVAMWRAVPLSVWEYRIGGYQVVKKWLSYREESVLGRPLTKDEEREVTSMVRCDMAGRRRTGLMWWDGGGGC